MEDEGRMLGGHSPKLLWLVEDLKNEETAFFKFEPQIFFFIIFQVRFG